MLLQKLLQAKRTSVQCRIRYASMMWQHEWDHSWKTFDWSGGRTTSTSSIWTNLINICYCWW